MSVKSLSKDIFDLKTIVNQKNTKFVVVVGYTPEEEKKYYEDLISKPSNKFMKAKDHPFHSFESFLKYHRRAET